MERRNFLDRWGDGVMHATRALLRNPALAIGGITIVLFTVARVPTEIFYSEFGVRPEEVGLNSVQVVLQGSALILAGALLVGLVYGFVSTLVFLISAEVTRLIILVFAGLVRLRRRTRPRRTLRKAVTTSFRRSARLAPAVVPLMSLGLAATFLTWAAINSADELESGTYTSYRFVPWRAESVGVVWTGTQGHPRLPKCGGGLYYLGGADGQIVLYNSRKSQTHRINAREVEIHSAFLCSRR